MDVFHSLIIHRSTELEMKFCAMVVPCTRHIRIVSHYLVNRSIYNRFFLASKNRSGFHSSPIEHYLIHCLAFISGMLLLENSLLSKFTLLYNCIFKILSSTLTFLLNITIVDLDQQLKFNLNEIYIYNK